MLYSHNNNESGNGGLIFIIFCALALVALWLAIGTVPGAQESIINQLGL